MNTDYSNTDHSSQMASLQADSFALGDSVDTNPIVSVVSQLPFGGVSKDDSNGEDRLSAAAKDAIEFRVTSPGAPNRRLRLTGNRYTFGSAHGCSIQLADQTLRPMHAVLIRDAQRILVRAYSVPIEINSVRTTEAALCVGDTLRLGDYRFELLNGPVNSGPVKSGPVKSGPVKSGPVKSGPVKSTTAAAPFKSLFSDRGKGDRVARVISEETDTLASPPASLIGSIPKLNSKRSESDDAWHEQLRREIEQWRKRQEEVDRRESRCCDRETILQSRESELWSRAETLHKREAELLSEESKNRVTQEQYTRKAAEVERLQQASLSREELFAQKEAEFKRLQDHYRGQVEDARKQVVQSQEQAKTATDAIAQMREQFTALKDHLETLTSNQQSLRQEEEEKRAEQNRVRLELEQARDQAVEAKAESEAKCQEAETRLAEISQQYESICQQIEAEQHAANQSGNAVGVLQAQIEELQEIVQRATDESTQLKRDYLEARDSVAQLEAMLQDSQANHHQDHESWTAEADLLHESVQSLSLELATANRELLQLKEANESLTLKLETFKAERDDAASERDEAIAERERVIAEMSSLPSNEAFLALSEELGQASDQMNAVKSQYEENIAILRQQLAERHRSDPSQPEDSCGVVSENLAAEADEKPLAQETHDSACDSVPGEVEDVWSISQPIESVSNESTPIESLSSEPEYVSVESADSVVWTDDSPAEALEDLEDGLEQEVAAEKENADDGSQANLWDSHQTSNELDDDGGRIDADLQEQWIDPVDSVSPADSVTNWGQASATDDVERDVDAIRYAGEEQDSTGSLPEESEPCSFASQLIREIESSIESKSEDGSFEEGTRSEYPRDSQHENPSPENHGQDEVFAGQEDDSYEATYQATNVLEHLPVSPHDLDSQADESMADGAMADGAMADGLAANPLEADENSVAHDASQSEPIESDWGPAEQHSDDDADGQNFTSAWSFENADEQEAMPASAELEEGEQEDSDRYDYASLKEEEYDDEEPIDSTPLSSHTSTAEETASVGSKPEEEEDDSIEAYMNRLLKRVQGESSAISLPDQESKAASSITPASVGGRPPEQGADDEMESSVQGQVADSAVAEYDPSEPMIPRSQAPERSENLSAMRDLANQSARTAISRSVRVQTRDTQLKAMTKLVYAGIAAFCAFLIVAFVASWLKFVAAAAILVLGCVFAREGQLLFQSARQRIQQAEEGALLEELEEENDEHIQS
ncbi:hypothetical protein Q31b_24090 [Novipirellula aureliae]|uniref:Uncharacterized protein n=1 Tax=Novipirellula aureliae TaxID=2527966 RepID=A0A5C6E3C2_9BACT|nr:hypothetical protein [Novipirellula aureliae]TWU43370.1 hypothetical protein Q31b_24090 [Novipirellula aureliae]